MSNLGKHQDIAIEAKRHGGVDNLIRAIENNAIGKAGPVQRLQGAVLATAILGVAFLVAKSFSNKRRPTKHKQMQQSSS